MANLAEIKRLVEDALPGSSVEVSDLTGGGDHLSIVVTARQFVGVGLIDQHRMIHTALEHKMAPVGSEIHALTIKTRLP
jgi:stress-induced morphogen